MAITIQELIASDTISQAVDKINFNFDQLLLNGGGPVGPAGPLGPSGPIGGRGERGTEWYEGTDNPNVTPPPKTIQGINVTKIAILRFLCFLLLFSLACLLG